MRGQNIKKKHIRRLVIVVKNVFILFGIFLKKLVFWLKSICKKKIDSKNDVETANNNAGKEFRIYRTI